MFIEVNYAPNFLESGDFGYENVDFANARELIRLKDIKKCFIWMCGDKAFVAVDVFPLKDENVKFTRYCYFPNRPAKPCWDLHSANQLFFQLSKKLTRAK